MQFKYLTQHAADQRLVNLIAKSYSTLDYSPKLVGFLESLFPMENFGHLQKYQLHQAINSVIHHRYRGEQHIKHALFVEFVKKNNIGAFEINAGSSRVDFLAINGDSSSFEIKSDLDNLKKLPKQMLDYQSAFDYNHIVVDEKHLYKVETLVPASFGIWSYQNGIKQIHRRATLNASIDPAFQLQMLTKKELSFYFDAEQPTLTNILSRYNNIEINKAFKKALKNRYRERWTFIKQRQSAILPIDLQFFFNCNIEPEIIYTN
jgi:hypothetical protein